MDLTPILSLIQDSDITCKNITCRSFNVVDAGGTIRIQAFINSNGLATMRWLDMNGKIRINTVTLADGHARVTLFDKDEKERITAFTNPDGQASVQWNDKNGKGRIMAGTLADGQASVTLFDKDEKERITAYTLADGYAGVSWLDNDGEQRIAAGTLADGTVLLPTQDVNPPHTTVPDCDIPF